MSVVYSTVQTTTGPLPRCILGCRPAGGCWHEEAALRWRGLGRLYLQSPPGESEYRTWQINHDCVVKTIYIRSNKVSWCHPTEITRCHAHKMCSCNVVNWRSLSRLNWYKERAEHFQRMTHCFSEGPRSRTESYIYAENHKCVESQDIWNLSWTLQFPSPRRITYKYRRHFSTRGSCGS